MVLTMVHELALRDLGCGRMVGVDEVGRGPLAGPVMAAAVVVPDDGRVRDYLCRMAGDSKQLKAAQRSALAEFISEHCTVAYGEASVEEIDRVNIRNATFLAMERALAAMGDGQWAMGEGVVVDGNAQIPAWKGAQRAVVKGDGCELAIACASIVAKVRRDALMVELAGMFPQYGWARNAGYGTAVHLQALRAFGVTEHHRMSFAPVREVAEMARGQAA